MVDSFSIRNFRSFRDVTIDDCRRVNVLVGDNGSGKTALLEGLFLAAGVSPEIAVRTRNWRGNDGQQMSGSIDDLHAALWTDLFHKFETKKAVVISMKGVGEEQRSVTIRLNKPGQRRAVPPPRNKPNIPVKVVPVSSPIEFKWNIRGRPDITAEPYFQDGRLTFPPVPADPIKASFFAANRTPPAAESVSRFSELSQRFVEEKFVEKFRNIYTNVRELSIEVSGGVPTIYAAVSGLPKKIPLSLASGGMNKLVALLLAITHQSEGIVIIDEVENGFYYEHLPTIWKALLDFAREYDCQLFVSTHSGECLRAVAQLAEKNKEDFCLLRTVNTEGGTEVRYFSGERFSDAVLGNVEVR